MALQILIHTPVWVWLLLALLIGAGVLQMSARQVPLRRVASISGVFAVLSLAGVLSVFGPALAALAAWGMAAAASMWCVWRLAAPAGSRYDTPVRSLHIPGSSVPLLLMLGIFATKYAAGVSLALHPELAQQTLFAALTSALYGAFGGVFVGRALRLYKLVGVRQATGQWATG